MRLNKALLYSLIGLLFMLAMPVQAADQLSDISNHWAAAEINSASSEGWAFIENNKFHPDKAATREEVVWMLIGACEVGQVDGFDNGKKADLTVYKDTPSEWAKDRIATAIANGYIQGYPDKTIMPQAKITRAEFAVMLSRLIKDNTTADMLPFSDKIPDWSMDGIKKTYGKAIIKGYPDNTFKPDSNVTKAEALVMIKRWKDGLAKTKEMCAEFKKILSTVKYTDVSSDNVELFYYGKDGNSKQNNSGSQNNNRKYYIDHIRNDSYVVINDFSKETLDSLSTSLNILIPNNANRVINEFKSLSTNQEKLFEDNSQKITIKRYEASAAITIINTK